MFSGRPSVRASVRASMRPCVRDSRGSFMFPRYLQYLLTDFRQTFVTGASRDTDDLITFLGRKVKGHTIAAEAHRLHSTRRYRRVQLFLVFYYLCQDHTVSEIPRGFRAKSHILSKFIYPVNLYMSGVQAEGTM